ncbi:MAG: hypothetical protein Q9223_006745 [Gallowayella weberi]
MPFQLLLAEASDIPEIVAVHQISWVDDPIVARLMPDVEPKAKWDYDVDYYRKKFDSKSLTGTVMHKIVDTETGKLVAFAKWNYPHSLTPEQQAEKDKLDLGRSYPPGTNIQLYEEFFGRLDTLRKKYWQEGKNYCESACCISKEPFTTPSENNALPPRRFWLTLRTVLHLLVVTPSYQRKGLGTMLVREGLTAADRDNARAYIEASPMGLGLYTKFGWKEVDDIIIDMRPHGGTGMASEKCLIREPGAGMA